MVRTKLRGVGLTTAMLVLATLAISNATAGETTTYEVVVGKYLVPDASWATSTRFFPSTIKVHQNDLLHFTSELPETATLLPAGQLPGTWVKANWKGIGKPWSSFVADPNDGATARRINMRSIAPSHFCGWPGQDPCSFDASGDAVDGVMSSGLSLATSGGGDTFVNRELDFTVRVTAPAGTTFYVLSLSHPKMRMKVEVVAEEVVASDQAAIDATSATQTTTDLNLAKSLNKEYSARREYTLVRGAKVWKAWAGVDTPKVSLLRMYPLKLVINKGEKVKFNFSQLVSQAHTVTFPLSKALEIAAGSPRPSCEEDGVDSPPTLDTYPFCDDPAQLEFEIPAAIGKKAGDGVYLGGTDFESSGVRGGGFATNKKAHVIKFAARSNVNGFVWGCMVHDIGGDLLESAKVVVE
ncbi:MAG: hypothetical protein M3280_01600 [Actinomycetota bacterium]|nr:hypothetical protein [Actinomycetota bacterium]